MRLRLIALVVVAMLPASASFADDEPTFYDPVEKQIEGWTVKVDPQLLKQENENVATQAFVALANHLQRVKFIVPKDRCDQLQKLPIWIELHGPQFSLQLDPDGKLLQLVAAIFGDDQLHSLQMVGECDEGLRGDVFIFLLEQLRIDFDGPTFDLLFDGIIESRFVVGKAGRSWKHRDDDQRNQTQSHEGAFRA